ncbi:MULTISPECIES: TrbC/VirB2 family protein [Brucella]|uniref:VIRB2 type IV secretion n=1 Tax=Brucella tritici TaxID=94626 RepID=A0A6L3YB33_9HYPH|nr:MULTISPECIES: TrbC/VirB2 family protein [Brucella]KAB2681173.1 hypothetical protein F9L08_19945 [Brucella tritici]KAB2757345.1 hypothetical protein F9K98_23390 [Brucella anthropi]KAB2775274.1 hypothetical protein F9K99_22765 [Brucella anthropi]
MKIGKALGFATKFAVAAAMGTVLAPASAFAQSAAPVESVLDWFVGVLQGNVARSLGIAAVCFCGFMALRGMVNWMLALSIVIGLAFIFGAATLVDAVRSSAGA